MDINYIDARNPVYGNEEGTVINLEVNFEHLPEEYVPFSATMDDMYTHTQELFTKAENGDFGPVAAYVPPEEPAEEPPAE